MNAEMYKWVDSKGKTHFSDQAPDETLEPLDTSTLRSINTLPSGDPSKPFTATNNFIQGNGEFPSKEQSISGKLLLDGRAIVVDRREDVHLWVRDEKTGEATRLRVDYDLATSRYRLNNIRPGDYGLSVNVNKNRANDVLYPGDYRGWANFTIRENYSIKRDIDLDQIIHLTAPQDNNSVMEGWGLPCNDSVSFPSPLKFTWQSLGHNVTYRYQIRNNPCKPYKYGDTIKAGTTQATSISVDLPAVAKDHQYMLTITAYRGERVIGSLMTHGPSGFGWDYRFRVQ